MPGHYGDKKKKSKAMAQSLPNKPEMRKKT